MIRAAYVVKNNGDPLYVRRYHSGTDESSGHSPIPHHVRTCVMLYSSSSSTNPDQPYIMEHSGNMWVYSFLENFSLVIEATSDESPAALKKKAMSLGRAMARGYGPIVASWSGQLQDVTGLEELVDDYVQMDLQLPLDKSVPAIEEAITEILQKHDVAYVAVLDAQGQMIGGNVPDAHLRMIREWLTTGTLRTSMDLVPSALEISGYSVQTLRVRGLTAVAASYRGSSRMAATRAVSELGQAIMVSL
ncbi:MAG: hypothetical protein HXY34_07820 [Candidatus Thorarchaeota archaeon]|nr:hypothetical protein [Candidatus Thorarchaeota archaeon]